MGSRAYSNLIRYTQHQAVEHEQKMDLAISAIGAEEAYRIRERMRNNADPVSFTGLPAEAVKETLYCPLTYLLWVMGMLLTAGSNTWGLPWWIMRLIILLLPFFIAFHALKARRCGEWKRELEMKSDDAIVTAAQLIRF